MAWLLAKHRDWQERLRDEARALASARPALDELKALERLEQVWKETLRLFPVAGQLSRQALRETQLGPYRIPEAAFVLALTGTAGHDPCWWSAPDQFDPDRFSAVRAEDKRHKATFLPFGAGAHACIGALLANIEVKAFWHMLLTQCRIRMVREYTPRHTYTPVGMVSGDVELKITPL
jgi:cytochrome P450